MSDTGARTTTGRSPAQSQPKTSRPTGDADQELYRDPFDYVNRTVEEEVERRLPQVLAKREAQYTQAAQQKINEIRQQSQQHLQQLDAENQRLRVENQQLKDEMDQRIAQRVREEVQKHLDSFRAGAENNARALAARVLTMVETAPTAYERTLDSPEWANA